MSGIKVSATKRPPKIPKWPVSSGPVRKEFGFSGLTKVSSRGRLLAARACRGKRAHRGDEGGDAGRVLHPGGALDTGGDIDAARARRGQRVADIARVEAARQHPRPISGEASQNRPVERLTVAAGQHGLGRRLRVEKERVRDARISLALGEVGDRSNTDRLHDGNAKAGSYC